jgi:hypothetical protein
MGGDNSDFFLCLLKNQKKVNEISTQSKSMAIIRIMVNFTNNT